MFSIHVYIGLKSTDVDRTLKAMRVDVGITGIQQYHSAVQMYSFVAGACVIVISCMLYVCMHCSMYVLQKYVMRACTGWPAAHLFRTAAAAASTATPAAWCTVSQVGEDSKARCIFMSYICIIAVATALDFHVKCFAVCRCAHRVDMVCIRS
jgi:hypothetical protein